MRKLVLLPVPVLLLLLVLLNIPASAQSRKVSVTINREPITSLFVQIQKQSRYNIVYSDEIISDTMLVSIRADRLAVSEILANVLPQKQLYYRMVSDELIVIGNSRSNKIPDAARINTTLAGRITDQQGAPVPFASVVLLDQEKIASVAITSDDGEYQFAYALEDKKSYAIKVSSISFEPLTFLFTYPDTEKLKHIILKENARTLAAVSIKGERPLLERKADRYVVNVEGSILANGNNGLELLAKSPGVWVDSDGAIKIRGNQSVMVMINDVVQRMSAGDLAEYLRTLRSEDVSKIEIISSPPSEFEAEGSGGIIHIILKKARKDGLTGSATSQYRQQVNRPAYAGGMIMTAKVKNLYLTGGVSAEHEQSDYIARYIINYADQSIYKSNTDRYNNNKRHMFQLGAGYDISANQSIGIQYLQTGSRMNQYFQTYIGVTNSPQPLTGKAFSEWVRKPGQKSTTINYTLRTDTLGSTIKIIGDYVNSDKTELNNFESVYSLASKDTHYRNNTPNETNIYSLQTDFTNVYSSGFTFKKGLKFAATTRDNEVLNENYIAGNWIINTNLSNRFLYKEYLTMGYASLEKTFNKLSVKAGLRAEHTIMEGNSITANQQFKRDYLSLFPSVFLSQQLDERTNSYTFFSYSRRLQRPSFAYLNPYRVQFDNYLTQVGNPDLMPEYTHKFEVGGTFLKGFSADIYYAVTTDKIGELANPTSTNLIEYQQRNFDNSYEYGFSLNMPLKITRWWSMINSVAGYNLRYKLNTFAIKQTSYFAQTQNTLTFDHLFTLDFAANYRSPYVRANTRLADLFIAEAGVSKRIMNKNLLLRFNVSDLFNTFREKDFTDYGGTQIDFYQKRPTRVFRFYASYSFSTGKKFSSKKIEQSNDEEKSRIGN